MIGVTGVSVLGAAQVEELIRHGTARTILFASGSTKTVEFHDVAEHVERLTARARPRIDGLPVAITSAEVTDPQSGRRYGTAITLRLGRGRTVVEKTLVFIANLTPVNFLFYGVPTEAIDRVMAQLLRTTLALVRDVGGRRPPPARLYAVDRDLPSSLM